jgi:glutathione S-transferase
VGKPQHPALPGRFPRAGPRRASDGAPRPRRRGALDGLAARHPQPADDGPFWTYVRTPEEKRDHAAAARARDEAEGHWAILDRQLEGREYAAGGFSLADICLGPFVHRWFELPVRRPAMPNLEAYRARLHERHAGYRAHVAVPMT